MDRLEPVPRQRLRKGLLLAAALVFPAVFGAFSPYLVVDAARHGLVNLSGLVFVALFLSGLVLSRAWCGWACPMSLDVPRMVKEGTWDDDDCIQCARCADGCAAGAIRLELARGGRRRWD